MSAFAACLRSIRQEKGYKQREVAEHLGIRLRSYQAYEGGTREPCIDVLIALADYFQVTLDELVGRAGPRPAHPPGRAPAPADPPAGIPG